MAKTQFGQDAAAQQNAILQKKRDNKNKWDEMLAMLQFAHKGDPQTMLGFGLGRLLRDGFNTWMNNYKARGEAKRSKAWDEYSKLANLGAYSGSFDDYYNNVWEPRYQADKRMMQDDSRAQSAMENQMASDGRPMDISTAPTFAGGSKGKGDTEMQGADNDYVQSPGASATPERSSLAKYYAKNIADEFANAVEMPQNEDLWQTQITTGYVPVDGIHLSREGGNIHEHDGH